MNNITLYKKIEKLVDNMYPFDGPITYGDSLYAYHRQQAKNAEILHWLQVGEDSIQILKDKIRTIDENKEHKYRMRREYLEEIMNI